MALAVTVDVAVAAGVGIAGDREITGSVAVAAEPGLTTCDSGLRVGLGADVTVFVDVLVGRGVRRSLVGRMSAAAPAGGAGADRRAELTRADAADALRTSANRATSKTNRTIAAAASARVFDFGRDCA